ncbi:MAG: class I SAM-dependent methyltransferase [Patescibacteria group bacterium]
MKFPRIPQDIKDKFHKSSDRSRYERQLSYFEKILNPKKGARVLEIGGGEGITLAVLELNGYDAYSVEPRENYIIHAKKILNENGIEESKIKQGYSENIPFPDNFFDYVISYQVIEHVGDVVKTFQEVERVLKPKGETVHICPNYHGFYEGHYKVPMLPFMNKKTFKLYVSFLKKVFFWKRVGGHISYIDSLNFVSSKTIDSISKEHLTYLSLSDKAPEILKEQKETRRYKTDSFWGKGESFSARMIKRSFILMNKINLADPIVDGLVSRGYYVHLYIVGRKAENL